jgi:hypothetical protein
MTVTDSDLLHAARALRVDLLNELGRSNEIPELEPVEEILRAKESASRLRAKNRAAAQESPSEARLLDPLRKISGSETTGYSTSSKPGPYFVRGFSKPSVRRIKQGKLFPSNPIFGRAKAEKVTFDRTEELKVLLDRAKAEKILRDGAEAFRVRFNLSNKIDKAEELNQIAAPKGEKLEQKSAQPPQPNDSDL